MGLVLLLLVAVCYAKAENQICGKAPDPVISPLICNMQFDSTNHYACPRLISNRTHGLGPESNFMVAGRQKWKTKFKQLENRDVGIFLVGDSLTGTMSMQVRCLEEVAEVSRDKSLFSSVAGHGPYLANLSEPYVTTHTSRSKEDEWYFSVISHNQTSKYVVLNTGAWWGPLHVKFRNQEERVLTVYELLEAYKIHFRHDGMLMKMVRSLRDWNTTVIWRDTSPAGDCIHNDPYIYHSLFKKYNEIAREAFRKSNALILNIWDDTLPFYSQHLSDSDELHYCLFQYNSAQNIWIDKLIDLVLDREAKK